MKIINNLELVKLTNTKLLFLDINGLFIYLSQIPLYFGVGKNSFLVGIKLGLFQPNTTLNIFFIDSKNQTKPVYVTLYKLKLFIRCYILITLLDNDGFGTLVLTGTVKTLYGKNISRLWENKLNIKHQKKIYINTNQLTPSVLRFKNKPSILVKLNNKKIQLNLILMFKLKLKVKPIQKPSLDILFEGIQHKRSQYFLIPIDLGPSSNIKLSIYYLKFLNYTIVDNFKDAYGSFNNVYSGSTTSTWYPTGTYNGVLNFQLGQQEESIKISFLNFNANIYNGTLKLNTLSLPIDRLYCLNVRNFSTSFDTSSSTNDLQYKYIVYIKSDNINMTELLLLGRDSKIIPIKFKTAIKSASVIDLQTNYFEGNITSQSGKVFSLKFTIYTLSSKVYGNYKLPQIRDSSKFPTKLINLNFTHSNYLFSGSCVLTSSAYTKFTNITLSNLKYLNSVDLPPFTFNWIDGIIYAKDYRSIKGDTLSHFTGSLYGLGLFLVKTYGKIIYLSLDGALKEFKENTLIQLNDGWKYIGDGYDCYLKISKFKGQIHNGILHSNKLSFNSVYTLSIEYNLLYILSSKFNSEFKNLLILEIKVPNYPKKLYHFLIKLDWENENNFINLKSNGTIAVSPASLSESLSINGLFTPQETTEEIYALFTGSYQNTKLFSLIEKYKILQCTLTPYYLKIFNTSKVIFNNDDYSKLYIPVSLNSKIDYNLLYKKLYSNKNALHLLLLKYSFKNEYTQDTPTSLTNTTQLLIIIDDVLIYSGKYKNILVYYSTLYPNDNFQLLSTLLINDLNFPIVKYIDLPSVFSGLTVNLLFKHKDINGRYSPLQFFDYMYDIELDTLQHTTYIGLPVISGVSSVNHSTGNVILSAKDIFYKQSTIYLALELLYKGNSSGSVSPILVFDFLNIELNIPIGESGKYTFSWSVRPDIIIDGYTYTVSLAEYPNLNWQLHLSGSLDGDVTASFPIDSLTSSIKFELTAKFNLGDVLAKTAYKYKTNYVGAWSGASDQKNIFDVETEELHKRLINSYLNEYVVNAGDLLYIYISHPKRLLPPVDEKLPEDENQIQFIVNGFIGGFEKIYESLLENLHGYPLLYKCYRSVNTNLGLTKIIVNNY